ncbi:MAG: glycerol kinase GlpK, partial [Pseudomonadota bacterium]
MTQADFVMAIDQGTTSSRAMVFDRAMNVVAQAQQEFAQHYPDDGWVEHAPEDIWSSTLAVVQEAYGLLERDGGALAAIGITNQRETTLLWDRQTGEPVYNAIVWQDRRTAALCERLREAGEEPAFRHKTGLLLDPYFSCTKLGWLLDNVDGVRARAERGELAFGTVDTFLLWRLTGGAVHATDATNASRTGLFNIRSGAWDDELLRLFGVPDAVLPEVRDCAGDFGTTAPDLLTEAVPILGVAGDQQAAAIGQGCFAPGTTKSTYGTGCFVLSNTADTIVDSQHRLLSTVAYRLDGVTHYALEGSIFVAGAAVQWLRDGLGIIDSARDSEALASSVDSSGGVVVVPAFTGLGAPHWQPRVRGAMFGLTRDTSRAHIVRATLEAVCLQTHDLITAMAGDGAVATAL